MQLACTGQRDAMTLGDFARNGQAESGAVLILLVVGPAEAFKDMRQFLRCDTAAVVLQVDLPVRTVSLYRELNAAARWGELYGIVEQDHEHLPQAAIIPRQQQRGGFTLPLQLNVSGLGQRPCTMQCILDRKSVV